MKIPTAEHIALVMSRKGYVFFKDEKDRGYDLNVVGIRSKSTVPNRFDDLVTVFYRAGNGWKLHVYPATTDPGAYWLGSRYGGRLGTAILKEGQYRSAYQIGFHQGKYEALVQRRPVTVIRDFDRDGELDFDSGRTETGLFGINIHRAHVERQLLRVDAWSAGCQVIQSPRHFDEFMALCHKAADRWGNAFTYTLLHERDFD